MAVSGSIVLPATHIAPGETKAVNLTGAIKGSGLNSVTAAGLEFTYTGSPGSVVMSAQSVSKSENQVFRVPMVDAATISSSTGQYPWGIDGSSSTFVYLKNATDKPQQYHLQINFGDGAYSFGLKTIEPGQPIMFDLRALRDNQIPDVKGRTIPLNAAGGQVHWSIDGEEPLGLIGRAEQADITKGMSMTAACAECCPDSWYNFWLDPGSVSGFPGDTTQFTAMQQNITCYGEILDPFQRFPNNFTSTNPSVASCDSAGFATAQNPGTTNIGAWWTVLFWDFDLESGGCTRYLENANPDGICDVLPPDVITLLDVVVYEKSAQFGAFDIANLSLKGSAHEADTCGSSPTSPFQIRVHFVLPPGALNDRPCTAQGNDDVPEWIVVGGSATCTIESGFVGSGRRGHSDFSAYRAISSDDNPKIKVVVGGTKNGTPIDANGTISLTCTK